MFQKLYQVVKII